MFHSSNYSIRSIYFRIEILTCVQIFFSLSCFMLTIFTTTSTTTMMTSGWYCDYYNTPSIFFSHFRTYNGNYLMTIKKLFPTLLCNYINNFLVLHSNDDGTPRQMHTWLKSIISNLHTHLLCFRENIINQLFRV